MIVKFVKSIWPILVILGLVILLFITNYTPGTILSGWDNLHPEFNFGLNIKRSIFAVWQEYQGLGLLGGMAHSTDLPRQLFLLFLSLFLPIESLRYIWTFLMLFMGSAGAYFLIKYILGGLDHSSSKHQESQIPPEARLAKGGANHELGKEKTLIPYSLFLIPLLGAIYYLLNLATVQIFFVPYEAFSAFYGSLPWLILAFINYYNHNSRKNLLYFALVLLISIPSWYVQTFFIVFIMTLSIIVASFLIKNFTISSLLKSAKLFAVIFLINSFWLLPAAYFTITNSQVNLNSKINQMATETIFLQNKEFGTLPDVTLLKGFLFNAVDPNSKGEVTYMLGSWKNHLSNPFVSFIGYVIFAIIFLGFLKSLRPKNPALQGFSYLFIFTFIALAIDTFPFSYINSIFRNYIPIVNQIFRFPFTKFSTLASLVFAVLFAIGIHTLLKRVESGIGKHELWSPRKIGITLIPYSLFLILILFTLPAFRGHLFYEKERAKIPEEYNQLFTYFKNQDPNTKIANFPQQTFWGWSFYNWPDGDYGGSGFTWYGIKQPILDRAFDVWSNYNENYYFEISQAVYRRNSSQLEKILNKYQVNWLLIDKNIYDTASSKALFVPELEELLSSGSYARRTASFGRLDIYEINLKTKPNNFVSLSSNLPTVNKYNWNNNDNAYSELGNYITSNPRGTRDTFDTRDTQTYFYPFRSLFSLKSQRDKEFTVTEADSNIRFTAVLPTRPLKKDSAGNPIHTVLKIPAFTQIERLIPIQIRIEKTGTGTPRLLVKPLLPEVYLGKNKLTPDEGPTLIAELPTVSTEELPLKINVNGAGTYSLTDETKGVGTAFFTLDSRNSISVANAAKNTVIDVNFESDIFSDISSREQTIILPTSTTTEPLNVVFPKINDGFLNFIPKLTEAKTIQNCYSFRGGNLTAQTVGNQAQTLSSSNATGCTSFFAKNLPHDQSFAIFIKSKHLTGQALRFWVENIDQQYAPIDTYLPKNIGTSQSSFILPPLEKFGLSYAFHFDNASIGRDKTVNEINNLSVYPIFYNYLQKLQIQSGNSQISSSVPNSSLDVSHPNESLYIVQIANGKWQMANSTTLILSQSYDSGWKAYRVANSQSLIANSLHHAFPFVFGKEIKDHVMVNNWENGWVIDDPQMANGKWQIVIVYTPQYLQYLGFGLLIATFFYIFWRFRKKK